ncbi:ankyrin repeat and LEM domain-containing protein 1 isoform X1 [Drosophila elegans]|uniref:ankyrin repeat and LEM domain-containing protein 1 isoform X1 n=1 Tax=Drosophila elegans TaxID=30023 RepID=UPI0007E817C1|nr:ankyrin repeat and LEM domain-containing protein 1 isoform X1 [Drosophila elegans]
MSKLLVFSFIQTSPLQLRNFFNNLVKARGINYSLGTLHKHHTSFSAELEKTINSEISFNNIKYLYKYVQQHSKWYQENDCVNRHYFNYLLLDPRVTNKLRERAGNLHKMDVWYTFLRAIFYVGKGKATRPYVHLKKAQKSLDEVNSIALVKDPKLALIVSIWRAKHGVLLMQAFHSISSEDAQTREASIIDALSMNHLTNRRLGVYCGPARSSLSSRERKYLGIALLHKLLGKFLATEECELYPLKSTKNFKDKAAIGA